METDKSKVRNRWVTVRMNEDEYKLFEKYRGQTTEKKNSTYLRKLALREPVTKWTRSQSLDEVTAALIDLKKEVNFIGHNFNQVVHKLHTLDRIPEFRNWALQYDSTCQRILSDTTNILLQANQILTQWSQR